MKLLRIPYRIGLALILLFSAGPVVADSMSPFLSMVVDGFFTLLIVIVVWRIRPPQSSNAPQAK
jgi:hypothetical protein